MKFPKIAFLIFLTVLFIGCSSSSFSIQTQEVLPTDEKTAFITEAQILTPTDTKFPTSTHEITPTSTATQPISQLVTPIASTAIPLNMLTEDEQRALILELLKDNGGCYLPCIWGVNSADIESANLLAEMAPGRYTNNNPSPNFNNPFTLDSSNRNLAVNFYYFKNGEWMGIRGSTIKAAEECIMYGEGGDCEMTTSYWEYDFNPNNLPSITNYYLPGNILSIYGSPTSVLIDGRFYDKKAPQPDWYPFSLLLYYENQRFIVEYLISANIFNNSGASTFHVCMEIGSFTILTWKENNQEFTNNLPLHDGEWFGPFEMSDYRPLSDVTELTNEEFIQQMIEDGTLCFDSPLEQWDYLWWLPTPEN